MEYIMSTTTRNILKKVLNIILLFDDARDDAINKWEKIDRVVLEKVPVTWLDIRHSFPLCGPLLIKEGFYNNTIVVSFVYNWTKVSPIEETQIREFFTY